MLASGVAAGVKLGCMERGERGPVRKLADKAFLGLSFITLPLGIYTAGTSFLAGEMMRGLIFSGFAFMDYTQIKEHGRSPEKQSWYNPERIMDRFIGSNRLKSPTKSMVHATV